MRTVLLIIVFFSILRVFSAPIKPIDSVSNKFFKETNMDLILDQLKMQSKFNSLEDKFPVSTSFNYENNSSDFSFDNLSKEYSISSSILDGRQEASSTMAEISENDKWLESFTREDVQSLPVGIQKEISGVVYQIGFSKAKFSKNYTELTVFARVVLPQTDEKGEQMELFFGANNVKLTHGGGIVGDANLVLLGDVYIPFNSGNWLFSLKGGLDKTTGITENLTYISIDCDGVKELALMGEVQFSRKMLTPVDEKGLPTKETRDYTGADNKTIQIPNRVRGAFNIVATDWNNMVVDISLSPFVLAKHPNKFMFSVNQAVFDFSDYQTPDIQFPDFYNSQNLLQPSRESWRGVYVNSLEVGLPKEFKTEESINGNERVTFSAYNMIIDNYGLSGFFSAENVIPLESGRTSESKSWQFSVDKIDVELAANDLVKAEFEGALLLPVSEGVVKRENDEGQKVNSDELGLGYKGIISEEEYMLNVSTLDDINFSIWQAKAKLEKNSSVELLVEDGDFKPKAILNGSLTISADNEPAKSSGANSKEGLVEFEGIRFQKLILQTETPILQADYFGYDGEFKLANFPVSIADIGLKSTESEVSLMFDLVVNLMEEKDKGFVGTTRLKIKGEIKDENRLQRWKYKELKLDKIEIDAELAKIKLKGKLDLKRDDEVYGDGFSAEIQGTFGDFGPIDVKAFFGKKDFKYWYADAAINGLKINVGIFQLSGFAGGASYKMLRKPGVSVAKFSPSGLSYIPSAETGLGFKAMVIGAIGDESALGIGVGYEIQFNNNMGVNTLGFFGEVKFMKTLEFDNPIGDMQNQLKGMVESEALSNLTDSPLGEVLLDKADIEYPESTSAEAAIEGRIGILFDFYNETFHADMELYLNTPGGLLQGVGPGGRAGWGVVHVSKEKWYAYLGTPSNEIGIKLGVGPISLETGGYFMIGDELEGSPPPPAEVASILGEDLDELDYMRDENALSSGRGFAFGTHFKVDTGNIRFLIFYARFMAGAGLDIMMRDYGDTVCSNRGGDQIGIDGWYGNGQAYAYLQGELGIKIKLFFIKKKIPIIKAGAAVLLQAKAPNPVWMKGYLGGNYNLLGGLIKGKFRFKITLGEECEFENESPIGGIKMISNLLPKDGIDEVDVFAAPQATFSLPVNRPIVIPEDKGDKTYKVLLEKMELKDDGGKVIEGELEWSDYGDRVTFFSTDILPPNTNLTITAEVSFQEKKGGVYQTIKVDGQKALETELRSFKTGTAPAYIPLTNIEYCYPVVDQKFVYTKQYSTGYIQLKRGQDYLFDNEQWKSKVLLSDKTDNIESAEMNYNLADNEVSYNMSNLTNETGYELKIISESKKLNATNTPSSTTNVTNIDADNTFEVDQSLAENVSNEGVVDRLNYSFTTSKYNTFSAKINAINIEQNMNGKVNSNTIYLLSKIAEYEGFDLAELEGNKYTENIPLINQEATLDDNYYKKDIYPIVYNQYPLFNSYSFTRDTEEFGIIPKKSIPIIGSYLESLRHNIDVFKRRTSFPYMYDLPRIYEKDIYDIKVQVNNKWAAGLISNNDPSISFLDNQYKFMPYGNYSIDMKYTLPGNKKTVTKTHNFKNKLKIR